MLFWYFWRLEGKRDKSRIECGNPERPFLSIRISWNCSPGPSREAARGSQPWWAWKMIFLCCLYCKHCTCYLNLTCHKSNSSKQDGTGLLSTFICVDAGNDAGMWKWQALQATQSKGLEGWVWGCLEAGTQDWGPLCDLGPAVSSVQMASKWRGLRIRASP